MGERVEQREAITLEHEGDRIFAILHRPLDKKPVPAVVVCPGFAGTKCGKYRLFVSLGVALAKQGIALLRFDYRGSGDSEGEFSEATLEGEVSDTLTCINFLAQDAQIDPSRLGLLGRSFGGIIAALAARRHSAIKSLALWAPVFLSDPWLPLWQLYQAHVRREKIEDKQGTQALEHMATGHLPSHLFFQQFFQLDIAQEWRALAHVPLLHLHGAHDSLVKEEHLQAYQNARIEAQQSRFVTLQASDHDFSDPRDRALALSETVQWYKETL